MINADVSAAAFMYSQEMDWHGSPSSLVSRKRFHLAGPAESGQVTSLVRYAQGATFPAHDHPSGEEILVIDGIFSDEAGDWRAGSYLLNPEGYRHAPFSQDGCLIFVKLRQYPGVEHLAVNIEQIKQQHETSSTTRVLMESADEITYLVELDRGDELQRHENRVLECFVLDGRIRVDHCVMNKHDWFRLPSSSSDSYQLIPEKCRLYVKEVVTERFWSLP